MTTLHPEDARQQEIDRHLWLSLPLDARPKDDRLLDASGHGHAAIVHGDVTVVEDDFFGHCLAFGGGEADYIALDGAAMPAGDACTVAFWAFGDPALPAQTKAFWARAADGQRTLGVHLPWSDGTVVFDAGNEPAGYDRLRKACKPSDFAGRWVHWAFTKDAAQATMCIYRDGVLWHQAKSPKMRRLSPSMDVHIGQRYIGRLARLRVYERALSQEEIAARMQDQRGYTVIIETADADDASFDRGKIRIDLRGVAGTTGPLRLNSPANDFERGHRDVFADLRALDVGELTSVRLSLDGSDDWRPDRVIVDRGPGQRMYIFENHRRAWLDEGRRGQPWLDLSGRPGRRYAMAVETSDIAHSGTNDEVSFEVIGARGTTRTVQLGTGGQGFGVGEMCSGIFYAIDVGEPRAITLHKTGSDGWRPASLLLTADQPARGWRFCNRDDVVLDDSVGRHLELTLDTPSPAVGGPCRRSTSASPTSTATARPNCC